MISVLFTFACILYILYRDKQRFASNAFYMQNCSLMKIFAEIMSEKKITSTKYFSRNSTLISPHSSYSPASISPVTNFSFLSDSNPPFLARNLPFSVNISGLPFSLNILLVFETLPSQRKIMFSLFNQSFLARFFAVFLCFLNHFYPFGIRT